MPVVRIAIHDGKPPEHKKALPDGVHRTPAHAFTVPELERRQVLHEVDAERFEQPPERTVCGSILRYTL